MKQYKSLVWESIDQKTIEYCRITTENSILIQGYITGVVDNISLHVDYSLNINKNWLTKSFLIKSLTEKPKSFSLSRNEEGNWKGEDGKIHLQFAECDYIDISLTPLTNTLPIRRLSLLKNQSQVINVLYIDLPDGNLKPVKQRYINMGDNKYLFESLDSEFKALIDVNDEGFVTKYSDLWKLIKES